MAAAAILHSDHVNLLVFRYLQESGFESAAVAFSKDWHRPSPYRDPEHLPFAHAVQRNELITLIQTGLYHDELSERVRKAGRRFRWSQIGARESIERQDDLLDDGADGRPTSSGRRKDRHLVARPHDDFPTPLAKRQRRSEGSDTHVNGERDAMEVDGASADGEEEGDTASGGGASEPEVIERYDSMEIGTQTVIKTGPKTSTMSWTVDKPGAAVVQAIWNPSSKASDKQTLMTVGDDLCRFYQVPESLDDTKQLTHVDEPSLPAESAVTAVTWYPDGQGACCAIDGFRDLPSGGKLALQLLLERRQDCSSVSLQLGPPSLEPPGIILAVRYSLDGEYLLALRTNSIRSLLQIWKSSHNDTEESQSPREPIAWRMFDHEVYDVAWTTNDTFMVCGDNGLTPLYQVDGSQVADADTQVISGVDSRIGLIEQNPSILGGHSKWDKVRYDRRTRTAVFASLNERRMFVTSRLHYNRSETEHDDETASHSDDDAEIALPSDSNLEALALQPSEVQDMDATAEQDSSSFLAAAFDDGSCHVYSIRRSAESGTTCKDIATLRMSDPPATALAWSPDGTHLAVTSGDAVQIWSSDSFIRKNGFLHPPLPIVTWRSSPDAPGEYEGDEQDVEPSVSWSADGKSLVFAAKGHISVVRFTPTLGNLEPPSLQEQQQQQQPQVNGHYEP